MTSPDDGWYDGPYSLWIKEGLGSRSRYWLEGELARTLGKQRKTVARAINRWTSKENGGGEPTGEYLEAPIADRKATMLTKSALLAAAALTATLSILPSPAAATTAWTPTRVATTLQTMIPLTHTGSIWLAHGFIKTPACKAVNTSFQCSATLGAGINTEKVSLFVKPWDSSRLCVSRTGASVCTAPLMKADPRLCGRTTADGCLLNAAQAATHHPGPAVTCAPAGPLRFSCAKQMVAFTRGEAAWRTTVTP